ncbi:MAG: hypothetical protein KAS01_02160 [Candidatus Pacebacteria bacterium]|nr:hypothetical protein [Candidatus Paceibacterota bacterium]
MKEAKLNKKVFSNKEMEDIKMKHKEEIELLSKLLISRDLELNKINENLDDKIIQLEKSHAIMEDVKDVLAIRLNARTKQLKEVIDGLDWQVKERTKKLETSQRKLMDTLEDYKIEKTISQTEKNKTIAIIKNMSDGLLIFNQNNILTTVNEMAIKFLNLENIKKNIYKQKSTSDLTKIENFKSVINITGTEIKNVFRKELKINDNDDYIEISTMPILIDKKQIGKFIILHDITREKKVQALKTEFVSIAAHQLRTPLSAIKWTLTTLIDGDFGELNAKQLTYLKKANISNERMIELVNDLLNLSRIEAGKYIQIKDFLKIEDLINEVMEDEKIKAKKKNIILEFKKDNNLPELSVDKEKIMLLIQNLIENALNYCYENTKIYMNLTEDRTKNEIQFAITNTGIGIPKKLKQRIFTKFFRADNALKTETVGSGLGLYINKNIAESHGGKIWFDSEEGKETTFYFTLPIKDKIEEF